MDGETLAIARHRAGVSQAELARRAGTSREAVSAYEHGHKTPGLTTLDRLLRALDHDVIVEPGVRFTDGPLYRGHPVPVPSRLPRLPLEEAFATVVLPRHLEWSGEPRSYDLTDRRRRARVYEIVLREGTPEDVMAYIDGALLIDLWDELVLPPVVHRAWQPVVARTVDVAS